MGQEKRGLEGYARAARVLRVDLGWSQQEVASEYGYTQPHISALESGRCDESQLRAYISFLADLPQRFERSSSRLHRAGRKRKRVISQASLELLGAAKEIRKAQATIKRAFTERGARAQERTMGMKGGTFPAEAYYLPEIGLWSAFMPTEDRLWNTYGLGDPDVYRDMVCHLTVPLCDIDRRMGAVYARDVREGEGIIVILHRGRIGGGREGIGKTAFLDRFEEYGGRFVEAEDGDRTSKFAYVAELGSATLLSDIKTFVVTVKAIKDGAAAE